MADIFVRLIDYVYLILLCLFSDQDSSIEQILSAQYLGEFTTPRENTSTSRPVGYLSQHRFATIDLINGESLAMETPWRMLFEYILHPVPTNSYTHTHTGTKA